MPIKQLDYGAHEGAELFNTDMNYLDGDSRMAARSDWFIQFWGYIFDKIPDGSALIPAADTLLLYINDDGKLILKDESENLTSIPTLHNVKQISWFMS